MTGVMGGKRGLIMGVANSHSIAWGIAEALGAQGAELAFTYQGDTFERRVRPLAEGLGAVHIMDADVQNAASLDAVFGALRDAWGTLDFLVHAIAYSDKAELTGRYADTSRANFLNTLDISCYSFVDLTRRAAELMPEGGSVVTMTYLGSQRVMPHSHVMGVAQAALEARLRSPANHPGPQGARATAISPRPTRTPAAPRAAPAPPAPPADPEAPPRARPAGLGDIGGAAIYLLSDLGASTTGDIIFVDGGYHATGMAQPENL